MNPTPEADARVDALQAMHRAPAIQRADADALQNHLTGLGTVHDKGAAARAIDRPDLTPEECRVLYKHNGFAARLVDKPSGDSTRHGWRVAIADEGADADPMSLEDGRLDVWGIAREALTAAAKLGGALIIPLTDEPLPAGYEGKPLDALELPLDPTKVTLIRKLLVVEREEATPESWEDDWTQDGFGDVKIWNVTLEGVNGVRIHASRVVYVPGRPLSRRDRRQSGGWDQSDIDWAWSQIRNVSTLEQTAASVAQEMKIDVVQIARLGELAPKDQQEILDARLKFMVRAKSALGAILLGEGEAFQRVAGGLTGYGELADVAWTALAAVIGMPKVVLYGDTPGGLNSDGESHRQMHQDFIDARQEARLMRPLRKLYTLLFSAQEGPTNGKVPESWTIEFHPIYTETRREKAEVEKIHAETDLLRVNAGVVLPEHVAESRFSEEGYQDQLQPFDAADLEAAAQAEVDQLRAELDAERMKGGPQDPDDDLPGDAEPDDEEPSE